MAVTIEPGSEPLASDLQERFCHEYIIDLNGTRAAKAAGGSPKSAHVLASRWLRSDNVRLRLAYLTAKAAVKAEAILNRTEEPNEDTPAAALAIVERVNVAEAAEDKAGKVLAEWELIAHSDIGDFVAVLPIEGVKELPSEVRRAVKALKVRQTIEMDVAGNPQPVVTYELTFWEKPTALKALSDRYDLLGARAERRAIAAEAAKGKGDGLEEGEVEITMTIPKASG